MPHTATVTAKIGPDRVNTAVAHPNVMGVFFDFRDNSLQLTLDPPNAAVPVHTTNLIKDYDLVGKTTVTCTITNGNFAFVIS